MSPAPSFEHSLAATLPDIPRWVETRSMLLGGRAEVLTGERGIQQGWAALSRANRHAGIAGDPGPDVIRRLSRIVDELGGSILTAADTAIEIPGWEPERALLFTLPCELPVPGSFETRLIDARDLASFHEAPPDLLQELRTVIRHAPMAATFRGGDPVSFCYAIETETLWDISIDTLQPYRGQGYGSACVSWMIREMRRRGKEPVWGALESNIASLRLAQKLGFQPVDEILVWMPGAA
ncbi:MAG: GNAT family N-acetyltransferase [Bryobacteraceae bacterium]|nr:GNAT family N-acetyltransferase [Bryobacteraceae bacterium]